MPNPVPDLDDLNQTVIYIPYSGDDNNDINEDNDALEPASYSLHRERDLIGGYTLRMKAYRAAWTKCSDRIQAVIKTLYAPIADDVVSHVRHAYSDILPTLPYPEIPVITLTAPTMGPSLLDDIINQLSHPRGGDDDDSSDSPRPAPEEGAIINHIYPTECTSITLAMKALITGFIKTPPHGHDEKTSKRKATTSVTNYDIELLAAWYEAVRNARSSESDPLPQLVVLLCDFEQFDTVVMADLFYICSLHINRLPFVFILSLSTPPSPSYLHSAYHRSTLALLHVNNLNVPSGSQVLEEILLKTFFDIEFEPDILLGPPALSFLSGHFARYHPSIDGLLTILQIAHMKHFEEPFTIFVHDCLLGTERRELAIDLLLQPESFGFLDSLLTRLQKTRAIGGDADGGREVEDRKRRDVREALDCVNEARKGIKSRGRRMRVAFNLMRRVQKFMVQQGHKSAKLLPSSEGERTWRGSMPEMMVAAMRGGRLGKDGKYLGMMIKKLCNPELATLLDELQGFFREMPSWVWEDDGDRGEGVIGKVIGWLAAMPVDRSVSVVQLAEDVGEWLAGYFRQNLSYLEESNLWDVWYTGSSPFPSELINPSIRASIISGLLHPFDYIDFDPAQMGEVKDEEENEAEHRERDGNPRVSRRAELWELPDTSILFARYLDSGRVINVYDWLESFAIVLEDQRRRREQQWEKRGEREREGEGMAEGSRSHASRKGKEKDKGKDKDRVRNGNGDGDEDKDKWKREVQARFMRALHELDYLGFLRHTGRKADHVVRTLF